MKIKKLIISAFGPYADRVELDFENYLEGKNMFVVSGNTGAGKTTIFDAVNFALYGEASGSDREGKSLRSDFADSKTPTEVELWFSLRGKEYYVKRAPEYQRKKQRGEGFTVSKSIAELKLSDKILTGPKEVTNNIEEILGITSEQFKQLVMIPQGEFKKLLNSDSDKKEDIFRKIFGTKIFSDIQYSIKDKASILRKSIEGVQRDRENRIRAFNCEDNEELHGLIISKDLNVELIMEKFNELIKNDLGKQEKIKDELEKIEKSINKISNDLALGESINKKFDELDKYKETLENLKLLIPGQKDKEQLLQRGKKAITVASFEDKYIEKNRDSKNLKGDIEVHTKNIHEYTQKYNESEKSFLIEQEREDEKNNFIKELDQISQLKIKVSEYEKYEFDLKSLVEELSKTNKQIDSIGLEKRKNEEAIKLLNNDFEAIAKAKEEKNSLEIKLLSEKSKKEKIDNLNVAIEKYNEQKKRHEKGTMVFEKKDGEYASSKKTYDSLEDTFRKNQAGILAKGLKEGVECPVCGSKEHPQVAELELNHVSEDMVTGSKLRFEKISEERNKYLNALTEINTYLKNIKETSIEPLAMELLHIECLDDLSAIETSLIEVIKENLNEIANISNKIKDLEAIVTKEQEKIKEKDAIEESNELLNKELEKKNLQIREDESKVKVMEEKIKSIKNDFKGEIKTKSELENKESEITNQLNELKASYLKAEKEFSLWKTALNKEQGNLESLNSRKEVAEKEREEALSIFKDKVLSLGFENHTDYINAKISESDIDLLEKEINNFNLDLIRNESLLNSTSKEIDGKKRFDILIIEETLEREKKEKEFLLNKDKNLFSKLEINKSIVKECEKYTSEIEKDEKEYSIIGKLSKMVNGDNSKKISFERYVLAAYFEDIISAANMRFRKMTNNRYELLRKEGIGDKRKGQGLDLEVFDNYTGKSRDVKTLSGGESFKASLSMALGLADVVQAYSGGIQLDTMFIDEGFGTLDPESLDNAIDCLIDLQNDGRVVGIISHVQELKDRIDTRLEVTATSKGSRAEFKC